MTTKLDDGAAISVTSLLFLGGVQLMQQLGPDLADVRTASRTDAGMRAQLNMGEVVAGGTVIAAGWTVAYMAGRWEPLVMALVVAGGSIIAWELAWRAGGSTVDPVSGQRLTGARS